MSHGGKREGAGRPVTPIDEKRVLCLIAQKVSHQEIAKRFGVTVWVIGGVVRRNKQKGN